MAERVADGSKFELAREAVERFLGGLPREAQVGLVLYGHKGTNQPAGKAASRAGWKKFTRRPRWIRRGSR